MLFKSSSNELMVKHMIETIPFEPDSFFYTHSHENEYEILYLLQGSTQILIESSFSSFSSHSLAIIPPNTMHHVFVDKNIPYERIVINIPISQIPKELEKKICHLNYIYHISGNSVIEELFTRLDHINNSFVDETLDIILHSAVIEILANLCLLEQPSKKENLVSINLNRILVYTKNHFEEIMGIEKIVQNVNLSKSTICKEMSENLHISPMTYVRTLKCLKAKAMIEAGAKATNIYESCGFSDYSTFFRSYVKTFGESPSQSKINNV